MLQLFLQCNSLECNARLLFDAVDAYLRRLAAGIEASSVGMTEQGAPVRKQRVYAVQLVRARKFYGYHADEQFFIKFLL